MNPEVENRYSVFMSGKVPACSLYCGYTDILETTLSWQGIGEVLVRSIKEDCCLDVAADVTIT